MGQAQSIDAYSTNLSRRTKGDSKIPAQRTAPPAEPAKSSPRSRRRTVAQTLQLKSRLRRQRDAQHPQSEAGSTPTDLKGERTRRSSSAFHLEGALGGLGIAVSQANPTTTRLSPPTGSSTMRPLADRSSTPGLSTSSSTVPSTPCTEHPTPKSHWSESSVGIPTPQLPFQSFRDSLNLNRLSQIFPGATLPLPSSPEVERLSDAVPSPEKPAPRRAEQSKRRKTGAGRPQIVVVDAQPVGAKRYSQIMAAEPAIPKDDLSAAERKDSLGGASCATVTPNEWRKASVVSTAGSVDVWDSDIPWPGMQQIRSSTPDVALSPRFSTTPAFLARAERLDNSLRRASDRRNGYKRPSSTLDLSDFVAAAPEFTFPHATTSFVSSAGSPPLPPKTFRRPSQMRAPAGHPASHHSRFSRTSSSPTSSPRSLSSSKSFRPSKISPTNSTPPVLAKPPRRRSSLGATLAERTRLDSVAETAASSGRVGYEVPVRLGPGASRRRLSARRLTDCTSDSAVSLPHSIGTDDAETARSPNLPAAVYPRSTDRDLPPLPTGSGGIDFSGYTLSRPATRPVSCISAGSELPPDLVDAFPAPPVPAFPSFARTRVPAKLDLSRQIRDSVETATASSPGSLPSQASTPSTSSFVSSLTSQASIDSGPKQAGPVVSIELGAAALAGQTYRPPSSSTNSVATFVLEDLIDELNGMLVSYEEDNSLKQPDPPSAEDFSPVVLASTIVPRAHSPPRFQPVFALDKPVSTSKPLPPLVSPLSHALLDDSRFDSPRLLPPTPDSARPASDEQHDLPPSVPASLGSSPVPPQKRNADPAFVPPSQRAHQSSLFDALLERASPGADKHVLTAAGASQERRLGSKDKRGFDKADIGAWLDKAARESAHSKPGLKT